MENLKIPNEPIARLGRGWTSSIAISSNGQYLALGNWVGLCLYDLTSTSNTPLWEIEHGMINTVAISPGGELIAASSSNDELKVWNIQHKSCVTQIELDKSISRLTFSTDSQLVAASFTNSSRVECWDLKTGVSFAKFAGESNTGNYIRPIIFSPDNHLVVSTCHSDGYTNVDSVVVWNVLQGKQMTTLTEHTSHIYYLCFSPCGRFLASGDEDGTIHVWHVEEWEHIHAFTCNSSSRMIPSYSAAGTLYATVMSYDTATVKVIDMERNKQLWTANVLGNTIDFSDIDDWGNNIEFSNGSHLAYESRHEFINVWTFGNEHARKFTHSPISFPESIVFLPDSKTLVAEYRHESVLLWDVTSSISRPALKAESAGKNQFMHVSTLGNLHVTSLKNGVVTLWAVDSGERQISEYIEHTYKSTRPALSSTSNRLACALDDGTLSVWDVQSGAKLCEFMHILDQNPDDEITTLAFSPDGRLLASESSSGLQVRLWDVEQGKEIAEFPSDETNLFRGFSPCGRYLACGTEDILLWDIIQCDIYSVLQCQIEDAFEYSPCGRYVACGNDKVIFLWDLIRCENFMRIYLPSEWSMYTLTFSSCGQYLAGGAWWREGWNKVPICLWEVATGENIATFLGHPTDIQCLAFSPDGTILASGGYDGTILLWDLKPYLTNT